jgi:hypothetical protein
MRTSPGTTMVLLSCNNALGPFFSQACFLHTHHEHMHDTDYHSDYDCPCGHQNNTQQSVATPLHLDPAPQVAYNTSLIGLVARRTVWAAATVYDRLLLLQKTRQCEVNIGSHKCFGAIRQESPQQFSMGQRANNRAWAWWPKSSDTRSLA